MAMEPGSERDSPQDNAPSSVRRVRSDVPQHVTVHGCDEVAVIGAEDYRRVQGAQTGQAEQGPKTGHTFSQPDLIIAATALHHGLTVVTRDSGGYEKTGASLLDPWQE